ncbi:MAG: metalloprotease TldD [Deltaproteobacteria bacterium]|nr:metalloprotease TldD [Deltaproteobacteria bacterium]
MTSRYYAPFAEQGSSPIDRTVIGRLLSTALSYGGDYADLFFEYGVSGSYLLDEGILKAAGRSVSMGLGVRVMKGDATGYAYVQEFTEEAMQRAASTAARIASDGSVVRIASLSERRIARRYSCENLSLDVIGEEKRDLLARADKSARMEDARIIQVEASFRETLRELLVATSTGKIARDRQPLIHFGVNVIAEQRGKRQSGSSGGGGRLGLEYFDHCPVEQHAQEAVRHAIVMLDARESPAGEMAVVLSPGDSGILLHEAVGHGLEADFIRKGTSNYTGRVGQRVASDLCTVVDDATIHAARGSINVDDEGNQPAKTVLIDKGVLRGFMHDRHSAEHFKTEVSGNGRRESFQSHPLPRMTNTLLLSGPHDPEEILGSVKQGVYARKFGGGQVDISNGDFVFSLTEGYLIENGRLTAPLKGVNLIGNGPDVMTKVTMLGNDMRISDGIWTCGKDGQGVPVGVGCPTVKISAMTVGGTQMGNG